MTLQIRKSLFFHLTINTYTFPPSEVIEFAKILDYSNKISFSLTNKREQQSN